MTLRWHPIAALLLAAAACDEAEVPAHLRVVGGDPVQGRALAAAHGCGACHEVPGLAAPYGRVGPPLSGLAQRGYIAGVLPNTPENLVRWLRDPPAIAPETAMPALGLDEQQARHIAALLLSRR